MYDAKSRFPRPFCQKQIPSSRYLFTLILFFVSSGFAQELELGLRLEGPGLATLEWPTSDEGDVEISADLITWTSLNGDVVLDGAEELYQSPIDISRMDHFYFRLVERQPYSLRDSEEAPGKTRLTWWPVNPDELPKLEYREMPTDVWRPVEVTPTQMADGKWVIDLIGFPDGTEFRVAANAEPGIVPIPDTLIRVGQQGSVDVMAADPDGDRVSFQALGLPEGATFDPVTGVVAFAPRPTQVGAFPVTITVSDGFASVSESFDLTVPQPPQRETTTLRGQILDANMAQGGDMMPVANIAVTLLQSGQVTMTDAQGNFLLEDIPAGNVVLDLNPDTVLGAVKYAGFREELEVFPLIENEISRPLYLPRVAMESMTAIDPGTDTMVANTTIGVSLEVLAGSAMDQDNGGAFTGELSISEVPQGFTPAAMPRNLQPSMVVTIQPVGVMFAQPAPITFPNRDNLAPGSVVDLWSLDAGTGAFAVVGRGRVSADGLRIETIEGGMRNTDWHFPLPEGPDINPMPEDHGRGTPCPSGSIVRLHNGALETEVALPPFFSMGQRRQVTLRYSSAQHAYKARVSAIIDQRLNNGSQPRPEFLSFGASTPGPIGALKYVAYDDTSPISTTVAAEIPLDDKPSGVQPVTVEGTYHYADSSVTAVSDVWVNVVNRVGAPYGAGWSIGGVQRIFPDPKRSRVLLVEDTYSAEFQRGIEREGFDLFAYGKALPFPDSQGTRVNVGDLVNGDFNNDGALDIITADETNSTLRVFLGRGDGDFDLAVNVPALEPLGHLATADFDGDGALDLVAARDSVGTIYVYQGLGNGSFVLANTITSPILAKWLRVGEFDGQPGVDFVCKDLPLKTTAVFPNLSTGFDFGEPILSEVVPPLTSDALTADFNGDGLFDMAYAFPGNTLEMHLNNGSGGFGLAFTESVRTSSGVQLVAGNFSGNALPDIVAGSTQEYQLFENTGGGFLNALPAQPFIGAANTALDVSVDLDGDSHLDAVFASNRGFAVLYGDGAGAFDLRLNLAMPGDDPLGNGEIEGIVAGDYDGDGLLDVAVTRQRAVEGGTVLQGKSGRAFRAPYGVRHTERFSNLVDRETVLVDLDNDGVLDLLSGEYFAKGLGDGRFAPEVQALRPTGGAGGLDFKTIVDVDQDGRLDMIAMGGAGAISPMARSVVAWGKGDGTFEDDGETVWDSVVWEPLPLSPRNMLSADFNNDGFADYAVIHQTEIFVRLYNPGSPRTFTVLSAAMGVPSGEHASAALAEDFNRDGNVDLMVFEQFPGADPTSPFYSMLVGQGDGTFVRKSASNVGTVPGNILHAVAEDFNADGYLDVAFAGGDGLHLMIGLGNGSFFWPRRIDIDFNVAARTLAVADIDADGLLDIVAGHSVLGMRYLPNTGTGVVFDEGITVPVFTDGINQIHAGDLDGDTDTDLLVLHSATNFAEDVFQFTALTNLATRPKTDPPPPFDGRFLSPPGDFTQLTLNLDDTYTRYYPNGDVVEFDDLGRHTTTTDRNGNVMLHEYFGDTDAVSKISYPGGMAATFSYVDDFLTTINTPAGVTQVNIEDLNTTVPSFCAPRSNGQRLTKVTLPGGATRRFTYVQGIDPTPGPCPAAYPTGLLFEEIDGEGNVSAHDYRSSRFRAAALPEGLVRRFGSKMDVLLDFYYAADSEATAVINK